MQTDKNIFPKKTRFMKPSIEILNKEEELKIFQISDFIRVRLLKGSAEVYGRELPLEQIVYFYHDQNISIFTWFGAEIEIEDHKHLYKNKPGIDDGGPGK